MNQLRIRTLAVLFAGAFALCWAASGLWESLDNTLPAVPLLAPVILALIAGVLLATALSLRGRLRAEREGRPRARPLDRMMVARAVVFGQASALVSALVGGAYGGLGLYFVLYRLDVPNRRDQALYAGLAVVAAVAVIAAALLLERVCRLPDGDEDDDRGGGPLRHPA
ncbi:DUF3180 domain-containing protein [Streptomyces sp. NPDC049881]|uniref:DUF3180 domain-containing protein n=1 Tax=unclassified Streptomyces TaxID=2593676 RepID=UPI00344797B0